MAGGFSLNEFMSVTKDFSRGYTFYVLLPSIAGITPDSRYLVRGARLPASTIESTTTSWQGNAYKLGTTQTFESFGITFNIDITDTIRNNMLKWVELTHNANDNIHGHPDTYMQDITVQHLNHLNGTQIITEYKLIKCWPTSVGALELAYESKEIAQFEVSFEYQFHTSAPGSAPAGGAGVQHG